MQTLQKTPNLKTGYSILIISLCACFLFYKYILQIYPSVITDQLMAEFHLTGAGLGNLAATFYYALTVTQLFVGVMLDKYSARWITAIAIFLCALGVFLFSMSETVLTACLSRGLMGIGVAFATVSYMKLGSVWFTPRRYPLIGGLLATAAMAGAVFGQAPLSWLIGMWSWRTCLFVTGIIGFALALLFAFVVRDVPDELSHEIKKTPITHKDILQVVKSKQNWLLTLYAGLAFSPVAVFGGLWGNPFIQQAYHLNKIQSASMVSLVFLGLGIGSPLLGILSGYLDVRRNLMFYCTLLSCAAITIVVYCHPLPSWLLAVLLFGFGFGLGAFVLVFTVGKELNKLSLTATVIAMINMSDPILDAITEPAIGKLLDVFWDGKIVNGVHYFSISSYHAALSVLPIYLICAALLLLRIKDRAPAQNVA
ncbi:MAG: MFS transporter [Gammaproteobacteria bacterium]|nr:MFS transporter [Gammaproteobacteria bacterium]